MKLINYIQEIESFLANGDTNAACNGLVALLKNENEELCAQVVLLAGQHTEIRRNQSLGIDDDKQGLNRINNSLIRLCNEIKSDYKTLVVSDQAQQELKTISQNTENKRINLNF
jgi:hypothetical protein